MKTLFTCLTVVMISCNGNNNSSTEVSTGTLDKAEVDSTSQYYTVLKEDDRGQFKNYEILIDSTQAQSDDLIKLLKVFIASECSEVPCHGIGMWTTKDAYTLYENKTHDPDWRKEYWPYVCEHYVADYYGAVGELHLYPFIDSEYRRWGGNKSRPKINAYNYEANQPPIP